MSFYKHNILMAEYIGMKSFTRNRNIKKGKGWLAYADSKHCVLATSLPFHRDWNWLIPVANKVCDELYPMSRYIGQPVAFKEVFSCMRKAKMSLDITQLYSATITAITFINNLNEK